MKILVVCQHYKPEPFRISDICESLAAQGHRVHVVTGMPNYPEGEFYPGYERSWGRETLENGVRVRRCRILPRKKGGFRRVLNYLSFPVSSGWYLSRLKEDFDVVLVHQLSPVLMALGAFRYARKYGKKVLIYCLDLWPESLLAGGFRMDSPVYKAFYHISRWIYNRADRILVTSKGFIPYIRDYLGVTTACGHLPQYAESLYDTVPEKAHHQGPYHFVFAGNVGEMQSVDTIVEAAGILKDDPRAVFDIVGDGSALAACRQLAKDLPNVVFHGRKALEEMPGVYDMADAMLVTLKDNPRIATTLPGKVQSCMAAGKAIIGAISGETVQVIRESGSGLCGAPEDAQALARLVREMMDRPESFSQYGKNARAYCQNHFRKDVILQKLTAELENLTR